MHDSTRASRRAALLGLLFTAASTATAQTSAPSVPREPGPAPHTVSVTGLGRVTLAPDRAVFTAGVQTVAPGLSAATQENGARMAAVIAALKRAGATERDIRTSALSI